MGMMAEDHMKAAELPSSEPLHHMHIRNESPGAYRAASPVRSERDEDLKVVVGLRGTVGKTVYPHRLTTRQNDVTREDNYASAVTATEFTAADLPAEAPGPSKKLSLYRAALEMQR